MEMKIVQSNYSLWKKIVIWVKLITFGAMNFVVFLTNSWLNIDVNKILVENLQVQENDISSVASFMYSSFFYGLLASSFVWPICVNRFSKVSCIVMGFVIVGFLNMSCYYISNIYYIYLVRFLAGTFQNIHTVGKDYLFDQFTEEYAKSGLVMDSCFSLLGTIILSP